MLEKDVQENILRRKRKEEGKDELITCNPGEKCDCCRSTCRTVIKRFTGCNKDCSIMLCYRCLYLKMATDKSK